MRDVPKDRYLYLITFHPQNTVVPGLARLLRSTNDSSSDFGEVVPWFQTRRTRRLLGHRTHRYEGEVSWVSQRSRWVLNSVRSAGL